VCRLWPSRFVRAVFLSRLSRFRHLHIFTMCDGYVTVEIQTTSNERRESQSSGNVV
jgi:hypothetical protein